MLRHPFALLFALLVCLGLTAAASAQTDPKETPKASLAAPKPPAEPVGAKPATADPAAPAVPGIDPVPSAPVCKRFTDCPQGQTCLVPKGTCQLAVIDCEQWGGYCAHWQDKCGAGYIASDPMHCPLGRSATCCLPSACTQPADCGPARWCYDGTCGPLGNCKTADDCVPQPLDKMVCPGAWKCVEGECEYRCE